MDTSRLRYNRGTSIVEVLVVMVILFVGILTVISLFPPGFLSVRRAENLTFAGRLAQYEIERWKNNVDNLPDGILPVDAAGNVLSNLFPGPPVSDDNALMFRRIVGETTRIPFGGWSTGPESRSIYILAFSPIDLYANHVLAIRGGSLSRRILDSQDTGGPDPWDFLRPYQYGVDYGSPGEPLKVCFRRDDQERVFYITYSWWEQEKATSQPEYRTAMNVRITVPAGFGDWITVELPCPAASFLGVDPYSEVVSRGFRAVNGPWSTTDPYEYKLIDPALGRIEFNPLGFTQTEFGQSLEARIDYDILDPQIIREDKRVQHDANSAPADPYYIKLSLNRIMQAGVSTYANDAPYMGLTAFAPPGRMGPDVVIIDLETGMRVAQKRLGQDQILVNYKDGIVQLVPDSSGMVELLGPVDPVPVSPAGRNFRFLYKADGDWSVQFHKAYVQYEREYINPVLNKSLDYKSYCIHGSNPQRLWFAACNGNHTVSVDYESAASGGKIVGETHKASDVLLPNPHGITGSGGGTIKWTYIDLNEAPSRIFSVNGISARARVVWRDGERWRKVDLDTTLVRQKTE